jgi:deoxycytidylate deaminase
MKYLSGDEEKKALEYIEKAVQIALGSTCDRARCGCVIVKEDNIIGKGFNSPPQNKIEQKRCSVSKDTYDKKVTDKTCCVHAEQRAIVDALKTDPRELDGSRLYFIRLGEDHKPQRAGKPYCTICSKMALDVGIAEFVLWHDQGVCVYNTDEYNVLSCRYQE